MEMKIRSRVRSLGLQAAELPNMETEHETVSQEAGPRIGDWQLGERYAEAIIKDLKRRIQNLRSCTFDCRCWGFGQVCESLV